MEYKSCRRPTNIGFQSADVPFVLLPSRVFPQYPERCLARAASNFGAGSQPADDRESTVTDAFCVNGVVNEASKIKSDSVDEIFEADTPNALPAVQSSLLPVSFLSRRSFTKKT